MPNTKHLTARLILLSAMPAVMEGHTVMTLGKLPAPAEGSEPPKEFLMWEFGEIETTKGIFSLTKEGAAEIVKKVQERGLELAFDYEHATFNPVDNGPVPAAGWHTLELREDGLWLTGIEWTAKAYEMIKSRELRYYSPAFEVNEKNEISDYYNCALTNLPATKNLKPLVASARAKAGQRVTTDRRTLSAKEAEALSFDTIRTELSDLIRAAYSGNDWGTWIVELFDGYAIFEFKGDLWKVNYKTEGGEVALVGDAVEVQRAYNEVAGGETMKTLLVTLGLKEGASETEAVTLARDLMGQHTQLLSLTGAANAAEALGTVQGWKANSERLSTVETELNTVKAEAQDKERKDLVALGMKDGKIPPALQSYWEGQPLESVRQYLSAVMPNPAVAGKPSDTAGTPANPGTGAGGVVLTGAASEVAKAFGNDPAKVAEYLAKRQN